MLLKLNIKDTCTIMIKWMKICNDWLIQTIRKPLCQIELVATQNFEFGFGTSWILVVKYIFYCIFYVSYIPYVLLKNART